MAARRPSPVPMVLAALAVLGGLWFARGRLLRATTARAPARTPDGAVYLRHVAPALRRAECARGGCHGAPGASFRLSPELGDAADAVREFHDASARVTAGDAARSPLYARAVGRGHAGAPGLREESCEARALRAWIEGRAVGPCAP